MDGNRRYAENLGILPHEGHVKGKNTLENLSDWCRNLGIKHLTVYAFSLENFNRDKGDLEPLMDLFEESFRSAGDDSRVHDNKVRVRAIGHREMLPEKVVKAIEYAENIVSKKGEILFVGTKKQARDIVQQEADRCRMFYVVERWLGGTLTNFSTIKNSIKFKLL